MAYQRPSQPANNGAAKSAAPAARPSAAPVRAASATSAPSTGKSRPTHDILLIDAEGELVKDAEGKSIEVGAIWPGKNPTSPLFIRFKADVPAGSSCKAFPKKEG